MASRRSLIETSGLRSHRTVESTSSLESEVHPFQKTGRSRANWRRKRRCDSPFSRSFVGSLLRPASLPKACAFSPGRPGAATMSSHTMRVIPNTVGIISRRRLRTYVRTTASYRSIHMG